EHLAEEGLEETALAEGKSGAGGTHLCYGVPGSPQGERAPIDTRGPRTQKKVAHPLKIGFGTADTTPPLGAEMPGGFSRRQAEGVHDSLYARALLLENGTACAAIAQVDCLSVKRSVVRRARELAAEWCGEPVEVMVAATHTHSGGPTSDCLGSTSDPDY